MRFRSWWLSLSFYWKTFILLMLLTTTVVALAEGVLEPLAQELLFAASGGIQPWHEGIMWAFSIITPSLICGTIFSRAMSRKMNAFASAAAKIARGNFGARISVRHDSRDVFDHLGKSFNDMALSLENLMENERRLLTDISHELRSPLARMNVALELLPMKQDPATREQLIARLEKEVAHMGDLVQSLLAQGRERVMALKDAEEEVNISSILPAFV